MGLLGVERLVGDAEIEAQALDYVVQRRNVLGLIGALFGRWRITERRDHLDIDLLRRATDDLAAWRARFDPLAR